jgi:hypothetical protein
MTKTNKTKQNKTQHKTVNYKFEQHRIPQKQGVNPGAREREAVFASYETLAVLSGTH